MRIGAGIGPKSLAVGMNTANATPPTLAMALTDNGPVMSQAPLAISAVATVTVATANTVSMAITLDSSLTFVSAAGSGWTCNAVGQVVTCTRATLVVGAGPTVTINVTSGSATKTTSNTGTLDATGATQAVSNTNAASVKLVAKDATSGMRIPQSATEWTNLMSIAGLAGGNPAFLWKCQEASGNLADSIGACTLTAANAPSYANAVSGWSNKAVGWAAGSTSNFVNTTTPPNGNASSLALLCYQYVSAGAASYREMAAMTTFAVSMALDASSHINCFDNAVTPGTENIVDGIVRPFLLVYNRAASTCFLYTGVDKLDGSYTSSAGVSVALGAAFFTTPTGGCLYATEFTGAAAEFSAAQAKTLLQTLGWTVSWS